MGSSMAQNLIKAGYKSSPEEVAASCDVTFAMLADPQSAVDVACGKHGAANGMGPGKGYVDVSTVDGDTSKLINGHKIHRSIIFGGLVVYTFLTYSLWNIQGALQFGFALFVACFCWMIR